MKIKIVFVIIAYLYFNITGQKLFLFMPEYLKKDLFMHLLCILTLLLFSKRSTVFIKYALVVKENEILKRQLEHNGIKVKFNNSDRRFFSFILSLYPRAHKLLTLVTPATVLYKWKCICRKRWMFLANQKTKTGRPSITMKIRKLILEMKKLNPLWVTVIFPVNWIKSILLSQRIPLQGLSRKAERTATSFLQAPGKDS